MLNLLPRSLVARVYLLYLAALMLFVGSGMGLFYRYQFNRHIDEAEESAVMIAEIATLVVAESAVIGDYDTIKRTLDKTLLRSPFSSAQFIDLSGAIVRAENAATPRTNPAPSWLAARIDERLFDVNRSLVVGGKDYGVLRIRFDTGAIAADIWELTRIALALAASALVGGLLLIWFPLKHWLGTLERLHSPRRSLASHADDPRALIEEVPLEFRALFERLAETTESLSRELANRAKAATALRALLENLVPDVAGQAPTDEGDLEAITQMISELVAAREASRLELDNQKFALDQHAIVSMTDDRGRITYANDKFCASSGFARAEVLGQTHRLINSGTHPPEFFAELWATIRAGRVWQGELCNRSRDGSLHWYSSSIIPLRGGDGLIQRFIGLSTDITSRKAAESEAETARLLAEQANRAKSEFLANMSHEIRTPMNGILGMTELALDTELTGEQRDYLTIVKSSSESLLTIINDILDFSKIEAGKLDIEEIPFDLPQLARDSLRALALRADEKGLDLRLALAPELPGVVIGDPGRLRQILVNLLGNAIKFTEHGEVCLDVRHEKSSSGGATGLLQFAVRDTGIGIVRDKQAHIFEAFTQEDTSTSRKYGGTGLGLSISSRLVALMGGRMWLESTPGIGSTFHFSIPCHELTSGQPVAVASFPQPATTAPVVAPLPAAQPNATAADIPAAKNDTPDEILLVEDNEINRHLAVTLLGKRGYPVAIAYHGAQAVEKFSAGHYAAILMDLQMPIMDGIEATRQIRQCEREQGRDPLPIIAMTANAMQGDRERCLEAGMNDYLSKPIKAEELFSMLERWAGRASSDG